MTRFLLFLAAGVFWAAMMALLIRREVIPYLAFQAPPTYRALIMHQRTPELLKASITLAGVEKGTIEVLTEPEVNGEYRSRSYIVMSATLPMLKAEIPVVSRSESCIDRTYRLSRFSSRTEALAVIQSEGYRQNDKLTIEYSVKFQKTSIRKGKQVIDFPRDTMLADTFRPYPGGGRMYQGKKWKINTLDFDLNGVRLATLYAVVTGREPFRVEGRDMPGYRVEVRKTATTEDTLPTYILFCNDEGDALVQKMTYEGMEYVITSRDMSKPEPAQIAEWNARWESGIKK